MSLVVENANSSSRLDYTVRIVVVPTREMMLRQSCHRFPLYEKVSVNVHGWKAMAIIDRRVLAYTQFFMQETRNIFKPVRRALGGQVCEGIKGRPRRALISHGITARSQ